MKRRILLPLLAVLLLLGLPVQASRLQEGSICIRLVYQESPEFPGSLTLFRVGRLREGYFVPEGRFAGVWENCQTLSAGEFARTLAELAAQEETPGLTEAVGPDGKVIFRDLEPGIYLAVQKEAAPGYDEINPFLVTVPETGGMVDATPKVHIQEKGEPFLPYTGQTVLPGIAMLCLGGVLAAIGLWLRKGR